MAQDAIASISALLGIPLWLLIIAIVWSLIWKGLALWKAARKNHLIWFVLILMINTLGIFEILYLYLFSELNIKSSGKTRKLVKAKKIKKFPSLK